MTRLSFLASLSDKRFLGLWCLVFSCIALEAVLFLGDLGVFTYPRLRQTAYEYGSFWPGLLTTWLPNYALQPYTMFVTYAFFHSGPIHLIVNMVTLLSLGSVVIRRVGQKGFWLLYGGAVIGGALGFGLLAETIRPMVGASGGLFGLAGGILAWNYIDLFTARERLWPILQAVVGLLLLNLVMWWLMDGLLAWQTHMGGFIAGWIMALLIDPRSQSPDAKA